MSENYNEETMEMENENIEVYDLEPEDYTIEESNGSGKVVALVIGGLAGAAALGVAAYKKLKNKKDDKPKKKRKKLMWVEVEDDEPEVIDPEDMEVVNADEANEE